MGFKSRTAQEIPRLAGNLLCCASYIALTTIPVIDGSYLVRGIAELKSRFAGGEVIWPLCANAVLRSPNRSDHELDRIVAYMPCCAGHHWGEIEGQDMFCITAI